MKEIIKKRPLFSACAVAFIIGIVCSTLDSLSIFSIFAVIVTCLLFLITLKFGLKRECIIIAVVSLVVSLSVFLYTKYVYESACKYVDKTVVMQGTIIGYTDNYAIVRCEEISDGETIEKVNFKSYVSLLFDDSKSTENLNVSTKISGEIRFWDDSYLDRFDTGGIHICATCKNPTVIKESNPYSLRYIYHKLRTWVTELLPIYDDDTAAFIKGMMFGDKSNISSRFYNAFSKIGLAHVMAVSGMHLAFAVLLFDFVLSLFAVNYRVRAYASIIAIVLFTIVTGFPVSCVRCAIMLIIVYIGRIINKTDDSLTSLAVSAILIVVFTPYNILSFSYLLSLSASFGIITITPYLNSICKINFSNKTLAITLKLLLGTINVSLGANIACLPVFIFVFKEVSFIAPITNLVFMIPIQILFYIGFLSTIFAFVPFVSETATFVAKAVYEAVEVVTRLCYNIKYTSINAGYKYFYLVFFLFAVVIVGTYVISVRFSKKKLWPYFASYTLFALIMFIVNYSVCRCNVNFDFVDVGQGSCAIASKEEQAVIFDCGVTKTNKLIESLKFNTVKRIELLALTHFDSDHVNNVEYLINNYEINRIIYPEFSEDKNNIVGLFNIAKQNGTEVIPMSKDTVYDVLDGAKVSVYVEKAYDTAIDDNTSAVYKFEYQGTKFLITGDMDVNQEYVYLKYGNELDCDVLLAAHHGARKSSLKAALEQYSPKYSIISVSRNNAYGLPDSITVSRLEAISKVLRTDELSTISFVVNEKGYRLKK